VGLVWLVCYKGIFFIVPSLNLKVVYSESSNLGLGIVSLVGHKTATLVCKVWVERPKRAAQVLCVHVC